MNDEQGNSNDLKGNQVVVLGKRVLVAKDRIDSGGMKLSPTMEASGERNKGKVLAVGQIGFLARFKGVEEGATILFKKHFIPNNIEGEIPMVFVEVGDILCVVNE